MKATAYIDFVDNVVLVLGDGTEIDLGPAPKLPGPTVFITPTVYRQRNDEFPYEFPLTLD